jgi:hypothetical protein
VSSEQENNKALARRFLVPTAKADLDAMDEIMAPEFANRSLMPSQEPDREGSCTQRPSAPGLLRTLGYELEALRRVVGAGREEVCVAELCVSHG